jgi:Transposase DDE domain group 1
MRAIPNLPWVAYCQLSGCPGNRVNSNLKAGAGLAHLPSGQYNANATWLLAATLAHNLLRWTARLGLGSHREQLVAKTLRRTLLALPGRLTRSGRQWRLHLPASWPWAHSFAMALARLRCIPYPT